MRAPDAGLAAPSRRSGGRRLILFAPFRCGKKENIGIFYPFSSLQDLEISEDKTVIITGRLRRGFEEAPRVGEEQSGRIRARVAAEQCRHLDEGGAQHGCESWS